MNINYSHNDIVNILYKNRFQNYKVNRLLKAWEKTNHDSSFQLLFDGHTISCNAPVGKNSSLKLITVNLDTLSQSKKRYTFSRILHNFKGKTYQQKYLNRINQLVITSQAFKALPHLSKNVSNSSDSAKLKKLKFEVQTITKHPELIIGSWTHVYPGLFENDIINCSSIKYKDKGFCAIPHNGQTFNYLDKLIRKQGIDKKGINHYLINDILKITFDLSEGLVNNKTKEQIEDLKAKASLLKNNSPYLFNQIDELLDYELQILVDAKENLIVDIQKPFEDALKKALPSCTVNPESSVFTLIFGDNKELPLDREGLAQHMLVFEDLDNDMDDVDLSHFELNQEDVDLLTLYFNQGDLSDENLHALNEQLLLRSFDLVLRLGIPRLEALLGKEISTRLIEETWEDGSLIIKRKDIQDPLQPIVDAVTKNLSSSKALLD